MALNRSPANMETEDGEKLQLILGFEVSKEGQGHSEFTLYQSFSYLSGRNICAKWEELPWSKKYKYTCFLLWKRIGRSTSKTWIGIQKGGTWVKNHLVRLYDIKAEKSRSIENRGEGRNELQLPINIWNYICKI